MNARAKTWLAGWAPSMLLGGCGDAVLDHATPVDELAAEERQTLCEQLLAPRLREEWIQGVCTYAGVDNMTDPEMCRSSMAECLPFAESTEDGNAMFCASGMADVFFECSAPVGDYLQCFEAIVDARLAFYAGFSCDDASVDPVPDPPSQAELPECDPLSAVCPDIPWQI